MSIDLFLEDKKFISVSRASKEIGYSQDYIGQLCRQKKIPAKLVGRTWFVDFESLTLYKKGNLPKDVKNEVITELKDNLVLPRTALSQNYVSYMPESRPGLPVLQKKAGRGLSLKSLNNKAIVQVATVVIAFFVLTNMTFSWLTFVSPDRMEKFNNQIGLAYEDLSNKVSVLAHRLALAQVVNSLVGSSSTANNQGVVAFPTSSDSQKKIDRVKNSFSDDVEVLFDKSGESGVIRPVFRKGDDSENYAFVLVPVTNK